HKNYAFRAYHTLCAQLAEAAGTVQSEKLALVLHEAIQAIAKLVTACQEKEAHIQRRAQQSYAALRAFATTLVVSGGFSECGYHLLQQPADCSDDNPKRWAEDCPRCLCLAIGRDNRKPATFLTPEGLKRRRPRFSPQMASNGTSTDVVNGTGAVTVEK